MESKVIIITGGSDGVGAAAAKRLSEDGHRVAIVGRSPSKTISVARELGTRFHIADFTRLSEVHELADELLQEYPRIDVLANNAGGVFGSERRLTQDGHEITFQVNYLAGFLLTNLLLERLLESRATVLCTSGGGNSSRWHIDINDLESDRNYSPTDAYGKSKLAQVIFARELHRRYGDYGLAAAAFHPGNLISHFHSEPASVLRLLFNTSFRNLWGVSPEDGVDTLVFLAEGRPEVDFASGKYFCKRKVASVNRQAGNTAFARMLWDRSENMIEGFRGHAELAAHDAGGGKIVLEGRPNTAL